MPLTADPETCLLLSRDFRNAGFTADAVRAAWGDDADDALGRGITSPAHHAVADREDALAVLARFFVLGRPVRPEILARALAQTGPDRLRDAGFATDTIDGLSATILIRPQRFEDDAGVVDWWFASDLDESARRGALPLTHVLGVGGASLTLAGLHLPTPSEKVLDLGSGCGIQAVRARRYADRVMATDISARALAFTEINALLNGVDRIQTRVGSLFEPVRGEVFDRVVSNPPFVITPRTAGVPSYEYRDGGREGDTLVREIVTSVAEYLSPGGVAQLLGNWEYRADEDGLDRVRSWVERTGLDAWVIEREVLAPIEYSELWIRDGGTTPGTDDFDRLVQAWLDDFAARGVQRVGFGYVLLRRPTAGPPSLRRFERVSQPLAGALGPAMAQSLATHDLIHRLDDDALSSLRLTVAPDVTEARHHLPGAEDPSVIELRQGGGFARTVTVDPALAALVGASDGDLAAGSLIDAIAELLEVDAAALREDLLPRVRELLFTGFLTPSPGAGPR